MNLKYEDMLSGESINIEGVGHVRSPKLKELGPRGIGWSVYNFYIFFVKASKADIEELFKIEDNAIIQESELFDLVVYTDLGNLYAEAFNFFMDETVTIAPDEGQFVVAPEDESITRGYITKENFDTVRSAILQLNFIEMDKVDVGVTFESESARRNWERVQKYQAQAQKNAQQDPAMEIGNLISKLCVIHPSYNLFNVWDLTIFQFYDQFFQMTYMRSVGFTERIVSNHGSDKFNYNDWMNPIRKS